MLSIGLRRKLKPVRYTVHAKQPANIFLLQSTNTKYKDLKSYIPVLKGAAVTKA